MTIQNVLSYTPDDDLLNISSFLLGTPEQLRLKHSNTLKRIQNKCKFKIHKHRPDTEIRQACYDEESIRIKQ